MKDEIILYRPDEITEHIEVKLEDETVWLSQQQMATLFNQTKQNISLHINNCFKEGELEKQASVKESLTVQNEGNRIVKRKIEFYNLDVIISVGYRVKSKQGTQFRIWATRILREYLLKGYTINDRMNRIEENVHSLKERVDLIDLQLNTQLIPTQGVFFDGQIFDAYELASRIIRTAQKNIVLIDNFIDESTLIHLSKKAMGVNVLILSKSISKQMQLDLQKVNEQYRNFEAKTFTQSHDRFLIIDNKDVYHLGASLKDLGRKWFAFSKLEAKSVQGILNSILELI
jgi:hypothetical protein